MLQIRKELEASCIHCVKSVLIWSYVWSVFSCIQSEYRKIRTRNNSAVIAWWKNLMLTNKRTLKDWFYLEMVSHIVINDKTQTPWKNIHFFFFLLCCIVIDCSWKLRYVKKAKNFIKRIHLITHVYYYYYYYKQFLYRISISIYYILLLIYILLKKN